jgi:serine/threonine protein kinase
MTQPPDETHLSAATKKLVELDEALRAPTATSSSAGEPATGESQSQSSAELLWQLHQRWALSGAVASATEAGVGVQLGPYELQQELGRGGFGVVFLARDSRTQSQVALKIPRPEVLAAPAVRQRFLLEAQCALALAHRHIVRVLEVGQADSIDFIATEYCPAGSLDAWLLEHPDELTPQQAARMAHILAGALECVHRHGLLHRDLKPSNVLLQLPATSEGESAELPCVPLLTDFGLARVVEQSFNETRSSVMLGTPLYMAPEQAACDQGAVGPATDVYSLGVILYELLVGQPPFVGEGLMTVLNDVRFAAVPRPRALVPSVPPALERICLKCLAKEPRDRYASAAELEADLARYLDGGKVYARPPSLARQAQRWARDPQRITDAGVAGILFNLGTLIWILWNLPYIWWAPGLNFDRAPVANSAMIIAIVYNLSESLSYSPA